MGTLLRYPYEVRDPKEYFDDIQDVTGCGCHFFLRDGHGRRKVAALREAAGDAILAVFSS
jgi:hypothetical protein